MQRRRAAPRRLLVGFVLRDIRPWSSRTPAPGAAGAGDPYFPDLGNGGYEVDHYDIAITVADVTNNSIGGRTTITATSTQALSSFDLDLTGLTVSSVTVDGRAAVVDRHDRELVVTPPRPIDDNETFTTVVDYSGAPEPRSTPSIPIAVGWVATGDGSFVISEPDGASTWFPVNDVPSDKATYTFHLAVPAGATAVANAVAAAQVTNADGSVTWTFDEKEPMASYLAEVAIGDYVVTTSLGPNGVTIRNAVDAAVGDDVTVAISRTPEMISYFASVFGPFPFDRYGTLVVNERTGFALETQTLSLFGADVLSGSDGTAGDVVVAHELVHQWFGDSVSLELWKDVWLNEGFATYGEWLWKEHTGGPSVAQSADATMTQFREQESASTVLAGDPGSEGLFSATVYYRGALTCRRCG